MKSIVYELESPLTLAKKSVELDEKGLGESGILAKTEFSAVSTGTEIAAWVGKPPLRPSKAFPRLVGYCNLARVIKVGSGVSEIIVGDYVLTHQSHRTAFICDKSDVLLRMREQSDITRKKLTATYLYHLSYSALLTGGYRPGYQIGIVGMGTLGIATASLVKAFGSQPLLFTEQEQGCVKLKEMGFTYVFRKGDSISALLDQTYGLDGIDIAINTSNNWSDYLLCMQLARKGGEVVCLGFPGRDESDPDFNPLDSQYFYDKQLTIRQCGYVPDLEANPIDIRFTLKRNMRYLSTLISSGLVNPLDILSIDSSWRDLEGVYRALAARKAGMYSAVLDWRS